MKLIHGPATKKIISVEDTPLTFTIVNAIVVAATTAAAGWLAHQGVLKAFDMEKISFDYNDRIIEDETDTE